MNSDIIDGSIADSTTLNLYAYVNGNPISYVDPFGMSADRTGGNNYNNTIIYSGDIGDTGDLLVGDKNTTDLRNMKHISWADFTMSEEMHLLAIKCLFAECSIGLFPSQYNMESVVYYMLNHFINGSGTDFTNDDLTRAVEAHPETQRYMEDFTRCFEEMLKANQGNILAFADSEDFHELLRDNKVYFSSYSYGGGLLDSDTYTGLTIAIHGWTKSIVTLKSYTQNGSEYYGTLTFTFVDNFGVDEDDINEYGVLQGFRSWYILQHYENYHSFQSKYEPYQTIVTIDYDFKGKIN